MHVRMSNSLVHACPGSVAATSAIPGDTETVAMRRGTEVHARLALYALTGLTSESDAEGLDDLGAASLSACRTGIDRMLEMFPEYSLKVEHQVDASNRIGMPGGSYKGTADLVLVSPDGGHIVVADHKTGTQAVPADTPQIAGYLIGMRAQYPNAQQFTAIVNQPLGADPMPVHARTAADMDIVELQIGLTVATALGPNPIRVAGPHCNRCRAMGVCSQARAFAYSQLAAARATEPHEMDPQQLADLLAARPVIEALLVAAREVALARLESDAEAVPGFKLGRTRAPRAWRKEIDVLGELTTAGFDIDQIAPRTPKSPAALIAALPSAADQLEPYLTPAVSAPRLLAARDALPGTDRAGQAIERLLAGVEVSNDL
jgi:hypothetical protein